jgi:hypothetical protein
MRAIERLLPLQAGQDTGAEDGDDAADPAP